MAEGDPKTFTQDEVNSFIAKEKKEFQAKLDAQKADAMKLNNQLEELSKTAKLSAEQREELEKQIEDARNQLMSADERAAAQAAKLKKESEAALEVAKKDSIVWQTRYTDSKIHNEIVSAAVEYSAFAPGDIVSLLRPAASIVEERDDKGKGTGNFKTVVKMTVKEEDKEVEKLLTPSDAVKQLLSSKAYLFKSKDKGGSGDGKPESGGDTDLSTIKDYNQYMEARKKTALGAHRNG